MKPGGGRLKGSAFERKVAKRIVTAFDAHGITSEDCYRTPGSGGHRFAKKEDPGDLVISKRLRKHFPFSIECKCVRRVLWGILFSTKKKKSHWEDWWKQATIATKPRTQPIVIFKENGGDIYAMLAYQSGFKSYSKVRLAGQWLMVVRLGALFAWLKKGLPF